ncbi:MAG: DUF2079 domain-containing protein [Thermoleophilia bacterium]|nr:DUF2079 domain-containing protein [Thermoleophilia bacterium]
MNSSAFSHSRVLAAGLVFAAGFAGGAVLGPALMGKSPADAVSLSLLSGLLAAFLWLLLAALTVFLSTRLRPDKAERPLWFVFAASLAPLISYFPYLLYRSGLEGDSVELPPLGARFSSVLLLLWSLALLVVLLRFYLGSRECGILAKTERYPAYVLGAMMIIWLAVFLPLDILKNQYMHVTTINSAVFREAMLNGFDERGFMYTNLILSEGASVFGAHMNSIMILIMPIFRLWPDYRLLLFISDVALALAAVPAYLIARRRFSPSLSLLMAAMLLFHPIMTAQPGRSDFSELRFVPVLFLTSFYFFDKKRAGGFAIAALLLLLVREDMGFFVAFFGIYALFLRRSWKWIAAPLASGLAWFGAMGALLLPRLSPAETSVRVAVRYSALGASGPDILKTVLFRPWRLVSAAFATPSHIGVAYGLLMTFGLGVPLLSGATLLAVPGVAELMLQDTTTLVNFMALLAVPTLMAAYILGLARLDGIAQRRLGLEKGLAAALVGIFLFFLGTSAFHTWFNPGLYQPRYNYEAALEALDMIPGDAAVRLPEYMLLYARPDQKAHGFHQIAYQIDLRGEFVLSEDYILLDSRIPARSGDSQYFQGVVEVVNYLDGSQEFEKVFARDDLELYVRSGLDQAQPDTH